MSALGALLANARLNAAVAWLVVAAVLVAAGGTLLYGTLIWVGFALAVVGLAVLPAVVSGDPTATLPWEIVAAAGLAVVARSLGALSPVLTYVSVAALALAAAVEIHAYTPARMTPRFAVGFVVVATMALAGAWTVVQFASDRLLGTAFLASQTELLWDLVAASAVGVVAGLAFELYFRRVDRAGTRRRVEAAPAGEPAAPGAVRRGAGGTATAGPARDPRIDPESAPGQEPDRSSSSDPGSLAGSESGATRDAAAETRRDSRRGWLSRPSSATLLRVARGMQAVLVLAAAYAVVSVDYALLINTVLPLGLALVPEAVERRQGYDVDAGVEVWITAAAFFHAVGALGPYAFVPGYDHLTHAVSASLVAGVGYAVVLAIDRHTAAVVVPPRLRATFIVLFVLAFGVLWELLEFGSSGLATALGGRAVLVQHGVRDTSLDLVFDAAGGVAVAVGGTGRLGGVAAAIARRLPGPNRPRE